MGKHKKLSKKRPHQEPAKPEEPAVVQAIAGADLDSSLETTLKALNDTRDLLSGANDSSPAIAREIAGIARAIVQVSGEQRARRKAFVRDARALSPQLVMEYLRGLAELQRHNVIRELQEMDEGGSVLA